MLRIFQFSNVPSIVATIGAFTFSAGISHELAFLYSIGFSPREVLGIADIVQIATFGHTSSLFLCAMYLTALWLFVDWAIDRLSDVASVVVIAAAVILPIVLYLVFGIFRIVAISGAISAVILALLSVWNLFDEALTRRGKEYTQDVYERRQLFLVISFISAVSSVVGFDAGYREVFDRENSQSLRSPMLDSNGGKIGFLMRKYSDGYIYVEDSGKVIRYINTVHGFEVHGVETHPSSIALRSSVMRLLRELFD